MSKKMDDFDRHWSLNRSVTIPPAKLFAAEQFFKPILSELSNFRGLRILDAGCGDGVHLSFLEREGILNQNLVVALDISPEVLVIVKSRFRSTLETLQGDVSRLPLEENSFDLVYSYGVLAYSEFPWAGLAELVRVTRVDGWVGIWIQPSRGDLLGGLFQAVRGLTRRLPIGLQARIADFIVPFLPILPTASRVHLGNATWRQCREVVLVNIAPKILHLPTEKEVVEEFKKAGLKIVYQDETRPMTLWGQKLKPM